MVGARHDPNGACCLSEPIGTQDKAQKPVIYRTTANKGCSRGGGVLFMAEGYCMHTDTAPGARARRPEGTAARELRAGVGADI